MTDQAPVCVVVPARDASQFIRAALASIAGQTVLPAEVIVVDDGSSDDTSAVARDSGMGLALRVVSQAQLGVAAARRTGISKSSLPLIALLDADDIWLPNHLEALLDVYSRSPGIIATDAVRWYPNRQKGLVHHQQRFRIPPLERQHLGILHHNFVFVSALFARRDYEQVAGFRDGFPGAEDWDLWIQLIRSGVPVGNTARTTCVYRVTPGSLTHNARTAESYLAVLRLAVRESTSDEEVAILEASIRRADARRHLARAREAAAEGNTMAARKLAIDLLARRPPASLAAESAGLAAFPVLVERLGSCVRLRRW